MTKLVRAAALVKLADVSSAIGLDTARMVRRAGLDEACLVTPDMRISEDLVATVLEDSAGVANSDAIGLHIAEAWRLSDFGVVSLLLKHQPTLRSALLAADRYRQLRNDSLSVHIDEADDVAVVREEHSTDRDDPGRQSTELSIGAMFCLTRTLLGPQWRPRREHFVHAASANLNIHRRLFGPHLEFGSDFNGVVLARHELDRPNPFADFAMARYAQELLDPMLVAPANAIAADVRRTIRLLLPAGQSSIEQVSLGLGLNVRSLQRQLEEAGESFTSLQNEARCELARRYLKNPRYPLTQVAELLGFSALSVFSRWFHGQFGMPPTRWRKELPG